MKILTIAIPFICAIGCTANVEIRTPIEDLKPGLNMLDTSDASWGVTAAYVERALAHHA